MDTFIMLVMVFSPIGLVWTRCLKFSVSFATEVEKNTDHRMDVLIEAFAPQDSKRATNYVHDLKSLFLSWNCILVHSVAVMVCVWLQPFLFFISLL